jgi:hypothetical protein
MHTIEPVRQELAALIKSPELERTIKDMVCSWIDHPTRVSVSVGAMIGYLLSRVAFEDAEA